MLSFDTNTGCVTHSDTHTHTQGTSPSTHRLEAPNNCLQMSSYFFCWSFFHVLYHPPLGRRTSASALPLAEEHCWSV